MREPPDKKGKTGGIPRRAEKEKKYTVRGFRLLAGKAYLTDGGGGVIYIDGALCASACRALQAMVTPFVKIQPGRAAGASSGIRIIPQFGKKHKGSGE
jgi:hypothetical protein